ncbi:SGNH/GDSL hydrolase family protein [Lysobacter pythonis]|uniref:SGNH/GDSL hydrolase family protein n=1 Tax=Solilutibacter pythonis TaxID=2483112 RepID=A0A3M2HU16_9GAMM|nr:SGNH/GDSL hydrolase family protein [Lysobacter pythonis]RMH93211.1 SGNH/GDSL hydrolase family protein [Lysobacter pythonis]
MTTLSYLALGDSYSIGEGVAEDRRWPVQLAAALRQLRVPLRDPRILATTGWTTDELAHALEQADLKDGEWDFVTLLIGVNDQYRGRALPEFATGFDALLHRAELLSKHGAATVMALSIPDWGATPFAAVEGREPARIAHELEAYNTHIRTMCEAQGAGFVDITAASRAHGGARGMLAADGLHPSATQYAEWTRLALPVARGLLEGRE